MTAVFPAQAPDSSEGTRAHAYAGPVSSSDEIFSKQDYLFFPADCYRPGTVQKSGDQIHHAAFYIQEPHQYSGAPGERTMTMRLSAAPYQY